MKVLYWRSQWESMFMKMWSQHLPTMFPKWSYTLFRKDRWFSPFAEHSMIASAFGWCLSKCYLLLTCCSNLGSTKRNGRSIDELICSDRDWKQTDWTLLLPSHLYSHHLICVRKTKFFFSENFPQSYDIWFAWGKRNFIGSQYIYIYIYTSQTH